MSHFDKPLENLRKANEEGYFQKKNIELAHRLKARLEMAQVGIQDSELANALGEVGYDHDSARALFFIPAIQVAWADGEIEIDEKEQIASLLRIRNVEPGSKAFQMVQGWLERKPVDDKFKVGSDLIGPIVLSAQASGSDIRWILESARHIAHVTGGLFGLGIGSKISAEEEKMLRSIEAKLQG